RFADAAPTHKTTADSVLFLNLAGGPAHLDTLDMKDNLPAETRSEFQAISSKLPGLKICEHLPKLATVIDHFTLIRGISHTSGDHPQGQAYIASGNRPNPAVKYPSYGSVIMKELPGDPDLPPYVAIPQTEWSAGYMGDAFAPFKTNAVPRPGQPFSVRGISPAKGLTVDKIDRREKLLKDLDTRMREVDTNSQLLEALDTFGQRAFSMITSSRTQQAFDVNAEPESIRKLFAADEVSQSLLLGVRLLESGCRFVTVTSQGWDTHLDNFTGHKKLLPPLDAGLTAAMTALKEKGLLDRTLVVAMGEFGRTPKINQNMGRDHYPRANWCLMAGGGVQPGQLIGATDANGSGPTEDTDIHPDDLGASIFHALGIDHHKEYYTKTGRPVSLIPNGRVIKSLFG
ncbi:MAG: hypothetical protein CMJ46_12615, partial [Planctomyces sp.]|nr:hypothetical protein [Planctomyces sp.]